MNELAGRFFDAFLAQFVQVTLLILVVGVVARFSLRNRPFLAFALWLIVLLKCVTPPLFYSPSGVFCWLNARESAMANGSPGLDVQIGPAHAYQATEAFGAKAKGLHGTPSGTSPLGDRVGNVPGPWHFIVVCIWLCGAVGLLLTNGFRSICFLLRLRADTADVNTSVNARVERLVRRLARVFGLRRSPRVVVSESNLGPAVFGVLRPTVLLPVTLVHTCRSRRLTPIILHELAHVRRGDLWLAFLSMLAQAIWWFHPLVWWSVHHARYESERCCDESVVARLGRSATRYAHSLIDVLAQSPPLQPIAATPGVRPVDITVARLERIMNLRHGCRKRMPTSTWILTLITAALVLPGAPGPFARPPKEPEFLRPWTHGPAEPAAEQDAPAASSEEDTLAQEGAISASKTQRYVVVYEVADLLQKLRDEAICPNEASDERIKQALVSLLRVGSPTLFATTHTSVAERTLCTAKGVTWQWKETQLVVSAMRSVHETLAAELDLQRKHGCRQISIEVRILLGDPSWQTFADNSEEADDQLDWKNRWVLFPQEFSNVESETLAGGSPDATAHRRKVTPAGFTLATTATHPIAYQYLSDPEMRVFMSDIQDDRNSNILLAPKITVFNGQTALISDTSQRPFVTEVKKVEDPDGAVYEPIVKVLWEGTKIQLSPTIIEEGVRIDCGFTFAAIEDCKVFRSPHYPDDEEVLIQHPVVRTSNFECSRDIPTGRTLLVGGLFPKETVRVEEQGMILRLLGVPPTKIVHKQSIYIAITPRTVPLQRKANLR